VVGSVVVVVGVEVMLAIVSLSSNGAALYFLIGPANEPLA